MYQAHSNDNTNPTFKTMMPSSYYLFNLYYLKKLQLKLPTDGFTFPEVILILLNLVTVASTKQIVQNQGNAYICHKC